MRGSNIGDMAGDTKSAARAKRTLTNALTSIPEMNFDDLERSRSIRYYSYSKLRAVQMTVVSRWDEKAGLRTGCCTLPSYRRAQRHKR